jgi:hypothetical protein
MYALLGGLTWRLKEKNALILIRKAELKPTLG